MDILTSPAGDIDSTVSAGWMLLEQDNILFEYEATFVLQQLQLEYVEHAPSLPSANRYTNKGLSPGSTVTGP
jgi:hypothetical protein